MVRRLVLPAVVLLFGLAGTLTPLSTSPLATAATTPVVTTSPAVLPSGYSQSTSAASLIASTCPAVKTCFSVGAITSSTNGTEYPLLETEVNGVTSAALLPLPGDDGPKAKGQLLAISCASTTSCVAVGSYLADEPSTFGKATAPLIEVLSGTTWTASSVSWWSPQFLNPSASLTAVHCLSTTQCVVAGVVNGAEQPLIATEQGSGWSRATIDGTGSVVGLNAIACASTTNCLAVGYFDSNSVTRSSVLLTETSPNVYTYTALPLPAGAAPSAPNDNFLDAISCVSQCVAVGGYKDSDNLISPLVETNTNGTWAATTPPYTPNTTLDTGYLAGVWCANYGNCTAVGGTGAFEVETNGTWSAVSYTSPQSAIVPLGSLTCLSLEDCVATTGTSDFPDYPDNASVAVLSTTGATLVTPTYPASVTDDPSQATAVQNVACDPAGSCLFVGPELRSGITALPELTSISVAQASVPAAPTNVVATPGHAQAKLTWTIPASNGSPILAYDIWLGNSAIGSCGGPTNCIAEGLDPRAKYSFTVTAVNALGSSTHSLPSATVAVTAKVPVTTIISGFGEQSAALTGPIDLQIAALAKSIGADGDQKLTLTGFTDQLGTIAQAKAISLARATAVELQLYHDLQVAGYAQIFLTTVGDGAANPIGPNTTAAGRALNRRVVVAAN